MTVFPSRRGTKVFDRKRSHRPFMKNVETFFTEKESLGAMPRDSLLTRAV